MKIWAKTITLATLLVIAKIVTYCSSSDKIENLAVGEKRDIKDTEGKVIGQYEQISTTQGIYRIDQNRDGRFEKSISIKEGKITSVDYDPDQDGIVDKSVFYDEEEKPTRVVIYSKDDQSTLGVGNVTNKKITSVELPGKKKRVYFKEDGSIERIENL